MSKIDVEQIGQENLTPVHYYVRRRRNKLTRKRDAPHQ
jgi:hypothetical protein